MHGGSAAGTSKLTKRKKQIKLEPKKIKKRRGGYRDLPDIPCLTRLDPSDYWQYVLDPIYDEVDPEQYDLSYSMAAC